MPSHNPICLALDTPDLGRARDLLAALKGHVGYVKLGLEFFYAHGAKGYEAIAALGTPIFLDLKLHDIPNTVEQGLRSLMALRPAIINVHATGGLEMMKAARRAVMGDTRLIAVTVLTSLSQSEVNDIGFAAGSVDLLAVRLAKLAHQAGLDGVVCSPTDLAMLRKDLPKPFLTVVPGIRPAETSAHDQKRIATPTAAIAAGADILVVGRAITGAADPVAAARNILAGYRAMTLVKICGLSTPETLEAAITAGADFVGFVFYAKSPRNVLLAQARNLVQQVEHRARTVALVVDADDAALRVINDEVMPDIFQAHGSETPERIAAIKALTRKPVMKAIKIGGPEDVTKAKAYVDVADLILFDAKAPASLKAPLPGGNGVAFDWSLLADGQGQTRFMLSGGLNPGNVAEAIRVTGAPMVDVSSGVESGPGIKDIALIRKFIEAAKSTG